MTKSRTFALVAGLLMAALTAARASDLPPEGGKALSAIVQSVERRDLGAITEVDFDDGSWEIEIHKGTKKIEHHLDPKTGELQRRTESADQRKTLPPEGGKALSAIIRSVERRDLGTITEVEFDDGHWEFEVRDGAKKIEFKVDPRTGKDVIR